MLYLCATPIGNLGDITLRAIDVLKSCDAVYCEDTRHTAQLMNHLDIHKPLFSCHAHNEKSRANEVLASLKAGASIVYVSDAGMPGISDPGAELVKACAENDVPYTVLPGASAVLTAAVMSGLPPQPFSFFGFLPRENRQRRAMLASIAACPHLVLLYESPHRVADTLGELADLMGDCPAAVLRELTKLHEQAHRGTLRQLAAAFLDTEPRGECVIAVLGAADKREATDAELDAYLKEALKTLSLRDSAADAASTLGVARKRAYSRALELSRQSGLQIE